MRKRNCYYCKQEAAYLVTSDRLDNRPMCFVCVRPFVCSFRYEFKKLFEGQPWKSARKSKRS